MDHEARDSELPHEYRRTKLRWRLESFPRRGWICVASIVAMTVLAFWAMAALWSRLELLDKYPERTGFSTLMLIATLLMGELAAWWFWFQWWRLTLYYREELNDFMNTVSSKVFEEHRQSVILDRYSLRSAIIMMGIVTILSLLTCGKFSLLL